MPLTQVASGLPVRGPRHAEGALWWLFGFLTEGKIAGDKMRAVYAQNGAWTRASSGDGSSFQRAKPQRLSVGLG